MDRALQERVVGAIVLVVVAVLIVPVFLDGPSSESEVVTAVVTLPGQNDQERKTQTVTLNLDRTEPVPSSAPVSLPEKKSEPANSSPPTVKKEVVAAPEIVAEESPPATESETGMWAVQLGSFSNQDNAERLAADLRTQGYLAFLSKLQTPSGELHRVRIGPQKDRDSADSVAAQLGRSGHAGQVVPHP